MKNTMKFYVIICVYQKILNVKTINCFPRRGEGVKHLLPFYDAFYERAES